MFSLQEKNFKIEIMESTFPTEDNLSGLKREDFQKEINGRFTDLFILRNKNGMEVAVTNYGCTVLSIMVPDGVTTQNPYHP